MWSTVNRRTGLFFLHRCRLSIAITSFRFSSLSHQHLRTRNLCSIDWLIKKTTSYFSIEVYIINNEQYVWKVSPDIFLTSIANMSLSNYLKPFLSRLSAVTKATNIDRRRKLEAGEMETFFVLCAKVIARMKRCNFFRCSESPIFCLVKTVSSNDST